MCYRISVTDVSFENQWQMANGSVFLVCETRIFPTTATIVTSNTRQIGLFRSPSAKGTRISSDPDRRRTGSFLSPFPVETRSWENLYTFSLFPICADLLQVDAAGHIRCPFRLIAITTLPETPTDISSTTVVLFYLIQNTVFRRFIFRGKWRKKNVIT